VALGVESSGQFFAAKFETSDADAMN